MTLTELCEELNNWFDVRRHYGSFKIQDGCLEDVEFLKEGRFYRIKGSFENDGVVLCMSYNDSLQLVHILGYSNDNPDTDFVTDEEFEGSVWELAINVSLRNLYRQMCQWESDNQKIIDSPYTSENFGSGGYSYTKDTSGSGINWKSKFSSDLNKWRKVSGI